MVSLISQCHAYIDEHNSQNSILFWAMLRTPVVGIIIQIWKNVILYEQIRTKASWLNNRSVSVLNTLLDSKYYCKRDKTIEKRFTAIAQLDRESLIFGGLVDLTLMAAAIQFVSMQPLSGCVALYKAGVISLSARLFLAAVSVDRT